MNFLTACLLANLSGDKCLKNNAGGQSFKFCIIPAEDVDAFPRTVADMNAPAAPNFGDEVCLGEGFTLATGADGWFEVPAVVDTVGINFDLVGEKGGYSFENNFVFFLAGMTKERLQFAKTIANCCEGFIIKTKGRNGLTYIIGTKDDPAFVEPFQATSGLLSTDRRGMPFVMKAPSACPPLIYDIDTHPLTLAP